MAKYNDTKFYWLQLKEDFFEDDAIDWLESQDNGPAYALFYLKLCLKSLKTNGVLIRRVGEMLIPYDAQALSKLTGTQTDTVKAAMVYLQQCGLINMLDNGEIYLRQIETMIGTQSVSAFKKQQQRMLRHENDHERLPKAAEIKGLPHGGQGVDRGVDICPPEIEIEIEKEIDIEIEIEKERERLKRLPSEAAPSLFDQDQDQGSKDEKKEASAVTLTSSAEHIPYEEIVSLYNTICKRAPKARGLNEARKRAIKARWKENGYSIAVFKEMFEKVEASDFLAGANDRGWKASFDWLMKPSNFAKVLEGNYDNRTKETPNNGPRNAAAAMSLEALQAKLAAEGTPDETEAFLAKYAKKSAI